MITKNLDTELKEAFRLLTLSNFKWLTDQEIEDLPKTIKTGFMAVPLNKDTFEDMKRASVFTKQWHTQTRQVMKKPRLFRVEVRMYQVGIKEPWQAMAIMRKPDTVHSLWKAIREAGEFIISENKGIEWDVERCKAVIKV